MPCTTMCVFTITWVIRQDFLPQPQRGWCDWCAIEPRANLGNASQLQMDGFGLMMMITNHLNTSDQSRNNDDEEEVIQLNSKTTWMIILTNTVPCIQPVVISPVPRWWVVGCPRLRKMALSAHTHHRNSSKSFAVVIIFRCSDGNCTDAGLTARSQDCNIFLMVH